MKSGSLDLYAEELLKLIFAEDQAALHIEGFIVLSAHPYVRHQLKLLQRDTNSHLLSILDLRRVDEPKSNLTANHLEDAIARDMLEEVDLNSVIGRGDAELIRAAIRLQNYLLTRYGTIQQLTVLLGLASARKRVEEITTAKQMRLEIVADSYSSMSHEEALHGFPAISRKRHGPVHGQSSYSVSHL